MCVATEATSCRLAVLWWGGLIPCTEEALQRWRKQAGAPEPWGGRGPAEEEAGLGCVERGWREDCSSPAQEPSWGWFYSVILTARAAAAVKAHQ